MFIRAQGKAGVAQWVSEKGGNGKEKKAEQGTEKGGKQVLFGLRWERRIIHMGLRLTGAQSRRDFLV